MGGDTGRGWTIQGKCHPIGQPGTGSCGRRPPSEAGTRPRQTRVDTKAPKAPAATPRTARTPQPPVLGSGRQTGPPSSQPGTRLSPGLGSLLGPHPHPIQPHPPQDTLRPRRGLPPPAPTVGLAPASSIKGALWPRVEPEPMVLEGLQERTAEDGFWKNVEKKKEEKVVKEEGICFCGARCHPSPPRPTPGPVLGGSTLCAPGAGLPSPPTHAVVTGVPAGQGLLSVPQGRSLRVRVVGSCLGPQDGRGGCPRRQSWALGGRSARGAARRQGEG